MALSRSLSKTCEILLKAKLVDDMQLRSAVARMEQWGGFLVKVIADQGMANEEQMVSAIAQAIRVPFERLHTVAKDGPAMARFDAKFCEERGVFPMSLRDRVLTLAMVDPLDMDTIEWVQAKVGVRVQAVIATPTDVLACISRHYKGQALQDEFRSKAARPSVRMTEEHTFELDSSAPPAPDAEPTTHGAGIPDLQLSQRPSANSLLDELVGAGEKSSGLTPEEVVRLETLALNQQKAGAILKALDELLREKGYR
jgi:hypothetical protein